MIKVRLIVLVCIERKNIDNVRTKYSLHLEMKRGRRYPKRFKLMKFYLVNEFNHQHMWSTVRWLVCLMSRKATSANERE